ncbi:formate dehydrogenase [Limnohabitans sp. T6-5]|uniref:formate dehydrogenase n=1 Tax=Limnohabitans sp. T6-5 TaxID=1100724 RepID=UPI000D353729|nr:formate dehydrogenase [Limnohabitans sp. T6-5]PUE11481.1 formate dehydrogenase [Limnohabitans sp. T6-5]
MSEKSSPVSRRSLFAGAATVGAVAAAASVLPTVIKNNLPAAPAMALPKPERGGGYSLSEHVQRYYKTTRI